MDQKIGTTRIASTHNHTAYVLHLIMQHYGVSATRAAAIYVGKEPAPFACTGDDTLISDALSGLNGMAVVYRYTYVEYTGPGRSRHVDTFAEPGPYVQAHRVFRNEYLVPAYFAALVQISRAEDHGTLSRWLRELVAQGAAGVVSFTLHK